MTVEMPTDENPVVVVEGDALEVLSRLPAGVRAATYFVVSDPPYGIGLDSHSEGSCMDGTQRRRKRPTRIAGDDGLEAAVAVLEWAEPRRIAACLFASPYRPLPGEWRNVLVRDKGPAVGGGGDPKKCWKRTAELVYVRGNGDLREGRDEAVLRFPVGTGEDFAFHPCQKPVPLLRYLIRQLTWPGDTIIDPFAGSGTTGVAAIAEGRKAILIEKEPKYAGICRRRVAEAMGLGEGSLLAALQPSLFPEESPRRAHSPA